MEIKIGKSAHACAACGREFVHEEDIQSSVRIEGQALLRRDYCLACWSPEAAEGAYSAWRHNYSDPRAADQQSPEQFSPMRRIFYEAVDAEDRITLAVAFLAAQLLRRQKAFRLIKETDAPEGEPNIVLFADRIGDRLIEVRDPNLTHAELEQGRIILMERLQALEQPQSDGVEEAGEEAGLAEHAHLAHEEPDEN